MKLLLFCYLLYVGLVAAIMRARGVHAATPSPRSAAPGTIRRVLVIGATGGTGRELVKQALERGYEVTAFVRTPAKLALTHPQLKIVRGDVLDAAAVQAAVAGQDAVVSALGHRRLFVPSRVQTEGMRNVLQAMEQHHVRRLVCVTALGLGDSVGKLGLLATLLVYPFILAIYFWDKSQQEQLIGASELDWVIVRPGVLTDAPKSRSYRHGHHVGSYLSMSRIGRADVADFMLNQLNDDTYLRQAPGIAPQQIERAESGSHP